MIRKVMTATINASHPQRGMMRAFDSLFETKHFDYLELQRSGLDEREVTQLFVDEVTDFAPDWLWGQYQNSNVIQADGLLELRRRLPQMVTTSWMGDCRTTLSDYLQSICKATHMSLIAAAGQERLFREAGAPEVHYLQIGLDWEEDVLGSRNYVPPFRVPDVVLCGNNYGAQFPGTTERHAAVRALRDAGIDVGVVGSGWPHDIPCAGSCHVKEQIGVWTRAKVGISISNFNSIPLYYSDRQLISIASGTPVVCYHVPELEQEFTHGVDCLFFHDTDELVAHVKTLLGDPELRSRIGCAGRATALRDHTWYSRIFQILPDIERLQQLS